MTPIRRERAEEMAREVVNLLEGPVDVRLSRLSVHTEHPAGDKSLQVNTELGLGSGMKEGRIVCISRYQLEAGVLDSNGDVDGTAWSVDLAYLGQWHLRGTQDLTQGHAQAFALAVGAMTLHPYVRAHVQAVVTASGYPAYSMGVLTNLLLGEEDEIDLDTVEVIEP